MNDEDEDGDDDFAAKSGSRRDITALIDDANWKAVAEAVDRVGELTEASRMFFTY